MPGVHAFEDDVLGDLDAVAIRQRIDRGEIRATEAVEAAIARAERVNPTLNAIAATRFDEARTEAMGPSDGALFGVPSFVKDTDALRGLPLLFGSHGMPKEPSTKDSPYVQDLRALGLVMLGKTTTPEFGLTGTTEARVYGPTRNPWNPDHIPGGSSGGAAAMVASGVVPIAHANDGGGSIRIPASCCGLVGLKPSRGRLAEVEGSALMPVKILHQGLISRSVRDTASFYAAIERIRPARRLPEIGHVEGPGPRRRIRFFTTPGTDVECHPECVDAIRGLAKRLQAAGHDVEEIESPFDESLADDFLALWSTMTFGLVRLGRLILHPRFDSGQVEPFTRDLARRWAERWHEAPGAILRLRRFRRHYEELFNEFDILLTPTLASPPPRIGYVGPEVPYAVAIERLREFVPYTAVQNVSGAPAISLPAGLSSEGLPIGAQFAAAHGQERTLLELAYEVESLEPFPRVAHGSNGAG